MILTVSDSEEKILNKIKSVLACESTIEFMKITHSEKLIFRGLEVDQLQRRVTRADVVVELTKYEYDLLLYLASSPNRVFMEVNLWNFSIVQLILCRPSLWASAARFAYGAASIFWRDTGRTTRQAMLMCHKVTHKNLIDRSPLFHKKYTHNGKDT